MTDDRMNGWGEDGGLGPLLDAYADARLRADPERTGRVRARVVAAARSQAVRTRTPSAAALAGPSLGGRFRFLRVPAAVAAGWLLVGALAVGGVLAASAPGAPLYGLRLFVEEVTLPSDPSARVDAEVARLESRLREARDAAAAGNGAAVTAALEAYRAEAEAALAAAGNDPDLLARLEARLQLHVAVLTALLGGVPEEAAEAIHAAVDRTEAKIDEILAAPRGRPANPGVKSPAPGKPAVTPKPATSHGPARTAAPKPAVTPKPAATPKPTPSHGPAKTPPPKPEATPKPAPSHAPGGSRAP